ncbi:efflux RND transporter periplasmic adaptor subunit [Ectothiorhodospiraceae bacterium 2226]|nr:efflux RND transporter periplasmic adaptor subunit [Ectothiorhodospiraceae bacterium 2226]
MTRRYRILLTTALALALGGTLVACGTDGDAPAQNAANGPRATAVGAAEAQAGTVRLTERSLGTVTAKEAPTVGAEVAGRVLRLHADEGDQVRAGQLLAELDPGDYRLARDGARAEIARLETLIENQRRQVERNRELLAENFISQSMLDDTEAQLSALERQLEGARAEHARAERDIARTRIVSPVDGTVEERRASPGEWVGTGAPLYRISTDQVLRVHLPFPERVATRLRPGLTVELASPAAPEQRIDGTITELRPSIGTASRAVTVIAEFPNPGGWRPGASVTGTVNLSERADAVLVPELAVVQRPAGYVVYVIEEGRAAQRVVRPGQRQNGHVEILEGLQAGERVVTDGAGFLTDGAPVREVSS